MKSKTNIIINNKNNDKKIRLISLHNVITLMNSRYAAPNNILTIFHTTVHFGLTPHFTLALIIIIIIELEKDLHGRAHGRLNV